jgi:hypothetical protein
MIAAISTSTLVDRHSPAHQSRLAGGVSRHVLAEMAGPPAGHDKPRWS